MSEISAPFQGDLLQLPQHLFRGLPLTWRQRLEMGQQPMVSPRLTSTSAMVRAIREEWG